MLMTTHLTSAVTVLMRLFKASKKNGLKKINRKVSSVKCFTLAYLFIGTNEI